MYTSNRRQNLWSRFYRHLPVRRWVRKYFCVKTKWSGYFHCCNLIQDHGGGIGKRAVLTRNSPQRHTLPPTWRRLSIVTFSPGDSAFLFSAGTLVTGRQHYFSI